MLAYFLELCNKFTYYAKDRAGQRTNHTSSVSLNLGQLIAAPSLEKKGRLTDEQGWRNPGNGLVLDPAKGYVPVDRRITVPTHHRTDSRSSSYGMPVRLEDL